MFSAFSFGKIIKTILPGTILAAAILLLCEGLWLLTKGKSLLEVVNKDWLTPIGAALIPLSLILGFLLNTFVWLVLNERLRALAVAELGPTVFPGIREQLHEGLWRSIGDRFGGEAHASLREPPREALEYFYLPVVSLTHLNYLWESYFSWYEFQLNTGCALALSLPSVALYAWARTGPARFGWFLLALSVALIVVVALAAGLKIAAVKNRVQYEKNLVLLIAGAVIAGESRPGSARAEESDQP